MKYDSAFFDEIIPREGTDCVKWDVMEREHGAGLNAMWVADMDFRGIPEISEAIIRRAGHPIYGYTDAHAGFNAALIDFMERRHHLRLCSEDLCMLPCVISGLRTAVLAFTEPGDRIIVQPPVYAPFYFSVEDNGRELAYCPLIRDENGRYTMDLDSVEDTLKAGARAMLLCNPHNPVGRAWDRSELEALYALLKRYDALLISDEIHEDFIYAPRTFVPAVTLDDDPDARILSLTAVSKTFNLAGLQLANAYSRNHKLLDTVRKTAHSVGIESGNIFAVTATAAAYRCGDAWLDGLLCYLKQGEAILREELSARLPQAVISPLEATYLAWVDLRYTGFTSNELLERCRKAGVEFTPGSFFGKEGDGYLRVNLACPHSRIRLAAEQLQKALSE